LGGNFVDDKTQDTQCKVCNTPDDCRYTEPGTYTSEEVDSNVCAGVPDEEKCEACRGLATVKILSGTGAETERPGVARLYVRADGSIQIQPQDNVNLITVTTTPRQFNFRIDGFDRQIKVKLGFNPTHVEFQVSGSPLYFPTSYTRLITVNADGTVSDVVAPTTQTIGLVVDISIFGPQVANDADGDGICNAHEASCLTSQYYDEATNTCKACHADAASSGVQATACECNTGFVQDPDVAVTAAATCVPVPTCTSTQIYVESTNVCANCNANQVADDNQCVCAEGFVDPPNDDPNSGCEQVVPCTSSDEKYDSDTNECVACDPGYLSANTNVIGGTTDDTECDAGCDTDAGYEQVSVDTNPLVCEIATCQLCDL